tara:strand:- start:1753 stop:2289 length:537 start_codon:yes stop_codon:yes gene_type:complete
VSKQDEMIEQLELLRSKYDDDKSISKTSYIEISNTMAEQIDPSLFVIRGDGTPIIRGGGEGKLWEINREKILNQFELIDAKDYQEEIKEGVIYFHREASRRYILTCIKLKDKMSKYYVMYGEMTNTPYISWSSSGYSGWNGYPTLRDFMVNWLGTGTTYILLAEPKSRTLNFSRRGFL